MKLGKFSLSLSVKDIKASKRFYENLGFTAVDGKEFGERFGLPENQDWLILKNGDSTIGLFQNMFQNNILTFHPDDARYLFKTLEKEGTEFISSSPNMSEKEGPCNFMLTDPDGNVLLFEQH